MTPTILLTGATGSLGRELLPRLIRRAPGAEMVLVLRGSDGAEVASRLAELRDYLRAYAGAAASGRLEAVRGDVTLPRLGMTPAAYEELANRVTHIVHAAASIGLSQPLTEARRVNVGGAAELLALAERCRRLEQFSHVSTAYVAGVRSGRIPECDLDRGQGFRNAYEQSKFEAETWMRARMPRLPITVFRPAILLGDSRDGHTCNFANIYLPLKLVARGLLRDIPGRADARLDLVPTDYAAEVIAELTIHPRRRCATYHVTAGMERSVRVRDLLEAVIHRFGRAGGRPLRFLGTGHISPATECGADGDALRADGAPAPPRGSARRGSESLASFFAYLDGDLEFDDATLRADLGASRPEFPPADAYLPNILAFCEATAWGRDLPWKAQPCKSAA
ncbi:MAG: SDR family oxidoreductase [Candidatus Eisenbacteria bacterium]|nr:SDR family oxidoreductase [Candidatus Eisenbacteria bacterium]